MISLQEQKLGVNKGIPTLMIAAASLNDVIAISGFMIVLGITFSKGKVTRGYSHLSTFSRAYKVFETFS